MEKRIIYTNTDGTICTVTPAYNDRLSGYKPDEETEAEYLQKVIDKSIPVDATNVHICNENEVMADRTFRNAWVQGVNNLPETDMPKAKVIAQDKIRETRNKKLQELDVAYQRADEEANTTKKAEVVAKKQIARDATADARLDATDEAGLKTAMEIIISEVSAL